MTLVTRAFWFGIGVGLLIAAMLLAAHTARAVEGICAGPLIRTKEQCEAFKKETRELAAKIDPYCVAHPDECSGCEIKSAGCAEIAKQTHDYHEWLKTHPDKPPSATQTRINTCMNYGVGHGRGVETLDAKDPQTASQAENMDDWLSFCMQQARYHFCEDCEQPYEYDPTAKGVDLKPLPKIPSHDGKIYCKQDLPENLYHEECWSRAKLTILRTRRRELPQ
jgi:hypothetical protein